MDDEWLLYLSDDGSFRGFSVSLGQRRSMITVKGRQNTALVNPRAASMEEPVPVGQDSSILTLEASSCLKDDKGLLIFYAAMASSSSSS